MKVIPRLFGQAALTPVLLFSVGVLAQPEGMRRDDMMMDGMMGGGWFMFVFGLLLFVALVLAILALLKYLFKK